MNIVEELRAHNRWRCGGDGPATDAKRLTMLIDAACAELEIRDKDVARYRWLRDNGYFLIGPDRGAGPEWPAPLEVDAIVDAAIGRQ